MHHLYSEAVWCKESNYPYWCRDFWFINFAISIAKLRGIFGIGCFQYDEVFGTEIAKLINLKSLKDMHSKFGPKFNFHA